MIQDFLAALHGDGPVPLADGAMGTMLQAAGLPLGTLPDEWNEARPEGIERTHRAYVAAGSTLVLTNTLNCHSGNFPGAQVLTLNRAAVTLARRSGARWVAGSLGPAADEAQARALVEAGVDLLWLETQLEVEPCKRLIAACQRVGARAWIVTFSFHRADGHTQEGERAATVAAHMEAAGALAVGLNCGSGLEGAGDHLAEMAAACRLPLVLKPNAGLPHPTPDGYHYPLGPRMWAEAVAACLTPRVRLVGGCCGTTPTHITALNQGLR